MTDQEIIERIASDFMGWQFTDDTQVIGEHSIEGATDTIWFRRDTGTVGVTGAVCCRVFDPLHDPASCMLALDEIERRGWAWTWDKWRNRDLEYGFGISKERDAKPIWGYSDARYRAVCLAVLEAIKG